METSKPSRLLRIASMVPFTIEEFWGVWLFSERLAFRHFESLLICNGITLLAAIKIVTGADVWPYVPATAVAFGICWLWLRVWLKRSYKRYRPRVDFATQPIRDQTIRRRVVGAYVAATYVLLFILVWFASY